MIVLAGCTGVAARRDGSTSSPPKSVSSTLGQNGGTVELSDGTKLEVGVGALPQDVDVTLAVATPPLAAPGTPLSQVVEFTPHGTLFTYPARISLPYSGSGTPLVMRLASPDAQEWTPVGGVQYVAGKAVFETMSFSFYVVTSNLTCTSTSTATACSTSCQCCGTLSCVDLSSDPANCGACGNSCGTQSFCDSASTCATASLNNLCANNKLVTIEGQIPADVAVVDPQQEEDSTYETQLTNAITAQCTNISATIEPEATAGLLDPCSDQPLLPGGNTLLVVGGVWSQRTARYTNGTIAPVILSYDNTTKQYRFTSRSGTLLTTFQDTQLNQKHDYFVVAVEEEPVHGSLILQLFGVGWQGTPAGSFYFQQRLLPQVATKSVTWSHYVLVEWTDNGDGKINNQDSWKVLAQDVP